MKPSSDINAFWLPSIDSHISKEIKTPARPPVLENRRDVWVGPGLVSSRFNRR